MMGVNCNSNQNKGLTPAAPSRRERVVLWLVLTAALLSAHTGLWHFRSGIVMGDPFTYICQARSMVTGPHIEDLVTGLPVDRPERISSGPVWNTQHLPDGRFAWTPAPGYPLLLAAALKTGGTRALFNTNLLLLLLVSGAFFCLLIQLGPRRHSQLPLAVVAVLLIYLLDSARFHQFASPWREPLLALLLLSALATATRGSQLSASTWIGASGFLLGAACSVKEASILYAPAVLLAAWIRETPRTRTLARLAAFGGGFLIGIGPLLAHNMDTTGTLLVSPQFLRATGAYSLQAPGNGLSLGNASATWSGYAALFRHQPLFSFPALALAAWGAWRYRSHPIAQSLLVFLGLHLLVYLQWGGVDRRHVYLACFPYAFFLAAGGLALLDTCRTTRYGNVLPEWVCRIGPAILLALAVRHVTWSKPIHAATRFTFRDAEQVTAAIISAIPEPDALVLANRNLRDVLAGHSDLAVIRLQDLIQFAHPRSPPQTVRDLLQSGRPLYFIDCADRDPRRVRRADWAALDERLLRSHGRLAVAALLTSPPYRLRNFVEKPICTVYKVFETEQTKEPEE